MTGTDLIVTNYNRNFTGVSATAAAVVRGQQHLFDMRLAGHALPGCPPPIGKQQALRLAAIGPATRPFQIWHVRRNPEMQAALFARDILRHPIRIVFTSAAQRRHSAWPRFLISRMDAIIATTNSAAQYVPNVVSVVPHGVDLERFHPARNRPDEWAATGHGGKRAIACIGRIRPEKGTDLFVQTAMRILPQFPNLVALVIGRAKGEHEPFLSDLQAQVRASGLADRIHFTGEVSAEKMPALIRALDLLVALPRYEGYGMTPLEAMASGVPVVASDTGHFREFLGEGEAGYVVASDDVEAAAARVAEILNDQDKHSKLARGGLNRAHDHFSVAREVAGISEVYEQLWAERPAD